MSNEDIELNILQQKLNALVAKYMHEKHIRKFRSLNLCIKENWIRFVTIYKFLLLTALTSSLLIELKSHLRSSRRELAAGDLARLISL